MILRRFKYQDFNAVVDEPNYLSMRLSCQIFEQIINNFEMFMNEKSRFNN